MRRTLLLILCFTLCPMGRLFAAAPPDPKDVEFFEAKVRPVLVAHCYRCHAVKKQEGGLRLDTRDALRKGGETGPGVVPGNLEKSLLITAVRYKHADLRMPPDRQLKAELVAALEQWVTMGAPDPRTTAPGVGVTPDWAATLRERRKWWSLQPVSKPSVPGGEIGIESANPVDRFIQAKLAASNLRPAPLADRTTLARRLNFVLLGLPPTAERLADVEADRSPQVYERLVDSLLASPRFGEHWARHWMDVVRYGDTYGYEWDIPARGAWRFRDYLTRAFNADVPFDQLAREQIAGDLLERPRIDTHERINESLIGPMFLQLGEKRHGDSAMFNGIHQEMLHNKIDAFSRAFQGLTVGCAQCHDHKIDAVSQHDYYALAGVFMSGRWVTNTLDTPERNRETVAQMRDLKRELRKEVGRWWLTRGELQGWKKLPLQAALPVEHPLHGWQALVQAGGAKKDIGARWKELAAAYAKLNHDRAAANARDFRLVADFRTRIPPGWSVDGVGLRDGPVRSGDFTVSLAGPRVIGRVMPAGLFTDALSPRFNGAVRTPLVRQFDRKFLHFQVSGGDFSAERVVVDNAFIAERQSYLTAGEWRTSSAFPEMKDRRTFLEYATKSSNPNFPPRVGLGGACSEEQVADPRSWFGMGRVFANDSPAAPADELGRFTLLFEGDPPNTLEQAASRYGVWLHRTVTSWVNDVADDEQVRLLEWMLQNKLLPNGEGSPVPAKVSELLAAYRQAEKRLLEPQTVNGLRDIDDGEDYRLNARGDFDRPTTPVKRGYLGVFGGPATVGKRSGRLELADAVASPTNPLTARVYVNRVWHWVFGAGLVATPDDFGKLGEAPSHPELLDYLAVWFIENGWSTKKLIRLLVTSRTFRQSGLSAPASLQTDPLNRLLHHYPLRRLEAEAIRDSILFASGRLEHRMFGPGVNPYRTHEDREKRLFSGPLDGAGRRSIYTSVSIMDPPKFLVAFNLPPPKIPTGKRDVTNVPAQALALLNDPFVIGQAEHWGKTLASDPSTTVEARIGGMFLRALGRKPTEVEVRRWAGLVGDLASDHGVPPKGVIASPLVWKDVAHSLFNTKEFIYFR